MEPRTKTQTLRVIFFVQIGLLLTMGLLATVGLLDNDIDVGEFFFAILLGALGASVSLMRSVTDGREHPFSRLGDLKLLTIFMPILYGVLMAGVAYLLFMSRILSGDNGGGLLTSNLFPNFTNSHQEVGNLLEQFAEMEPVGMHNTGKLLVWCFLAGYSERFVIGILDQLEKHGKGSSDNSP